MYLAPTPHGLNKVDLSEHRWVDSNGNPQSDGLISFFNPVHILAILSNYNALKLETNGRYQNDFYYLMEDFDLLLNKSLEKYPHFLDFLKMKFDGKTSAEIQTMLKEKYNISYSI